MKRVASVILLLALAAASVGCGTVKTDEGSVSVKNGQIQVKGNDGTTVTVNENGQVQAKSGDGTEVASLGTTLPEGYPTDVLPLMAGAKVVQGMKTESMYSVTYETKATPQEALQYYEKLLKSKQGYTFTDMTMDNKPGFVLTVLNDNQSMTVAIEVSGGATVVELAVGKF